MSALGLYTGAMTEPGAVRDFTVRRDPIRFRIDPDEFAAPGIVNPIVLRKIAKGAAEIAPLMAGLTEETFDEALKLTADIMRVMIGGKYGDRFAERLLSDGEDGSPPPINLISEAVPVLYFLMEQWGLRPTTPSATSSDGSTTATILSADTSSTDGASAGASSSENSTTPPTG